LLTVLGAVLLLIGSLAWTTANPLLDPAALARSRLALNWTLAAASAGLLPLIYTWLVAGAPDPLMAARGFAAGTVAIAADAAFVPAWTALAVGAGVGLLTPFSIFVVDHLLHLDDRPAILTVHGLAGALGLLAVSLFADGTAGLGWNGIGADAYLGVTRQGVTGLLAAAGYQPDWPGQLQAQAVGVAALALFGFFTAWLALAPLALLTHLLRRPESPTGGVLPTSLAESAIETSVEPAVEPAELPAEPIPAAEETD
jgi:Amt family ammonium transporter